MLENNNVSQIGLEALTPAQALQLAYNIQKTVRDARSNSGVSLLKNRDMYRGAHSQYFSQRLNEEAGAFKSRKSRAVVVNSTKFVVDLSAQYLYGRSRKVRRTYSRTKEAQQKNWDTIATITDNYSLDDILHDCSKDAAVYGEAIIRLVAVDSDTLLQTATSRGSSGDTTVPYPMRLDPINTFLLKNSWGRIQAVVVLTDITDWKNGKSTQVMEMITDAQRFSFTGDGIGNGSIDIASMTVTTEKNTIPLAVEFVSCKNNSNYTSDIESIIDLNVHMDELYTDYAYFFKYHGFPHLMTNVDLSKVDFGPSKTIQVPDDMEPKKSIQFLEWEGKAEQALKFIESFESKIFSLSQTARISTGDLASIGNLRSGAALIVSHAPAIHKTLAKQLIWGENEKNVLKSIAKFYCLIVGKTFNEVFPDWFFDTRFSGDFVPGDELVRPNRYQILLNSHAETRKNVLREEHPMSSEEEIEELYEEIIEDSRRVADALRVFESVKPDETTPSDSMSKSKEQSGGSKKDSQKDD